MFFSAHVLRLKQTEAGVPSERGSVARLVGNAWKVSLCSDFNHSKLKIFCLFLLCVLLSNFLAKRSSTTNEKLISTMEWTRWIRKEKRMTTTRQRGTWLLTLMRTCMHLIQTCICIPACRHLCMQACSILSMIHATTVMLHTRLIICMGSLTLTTITVSTTLVINRDDPVVTVRATHPQRDILMTVACPCKGLMVKGL